MSAQKPTAFVLMPFENEDVLGYVIRPALEDAYEVVRADTNVNQRNIVKDIISGIESAYLIVADLTGQNPNVMWELGVAHAMGKRTLVLTQDDPEDLPFDLSSYRVRQYSMQRGPLAEEDDKYIESVGAEALDGSAEFSNPVIDFCEDVEVHPAASWVEGGGPAAVEAMPGWLDLAADSQETQEKLVRHYEMIADYTKTIGTKIEQHTAAMTQWQRQGSPGGAAKARNLTDAAASDMFSYAEDLKVELDGIADCGAALRDSLLPLLSSSPLGEGEDVQEALHAMRELRETLSQAISASRETKGQVQKFKNAMGSLRGTSKQLDLATSRVGHRLGNMISEMDRHETLLQEGIDTLDRRIEEMAAD